MADGVWLRTSRLNENNNGFYGYTQAIGVHAGQTVLRTYWNIMLWGVYGGVDIFPPGTCLLRAGIVFAEDGLIGTGDVPTPVSNPEASWMDIETLAPSQVGLAVATGNDWYIQWSFSKDESVKAQRRAPDTTDMGVYISWEFDLAPDRLPGFAVSGYNCSLDALLTPTI